MSQYNSVKLKLYFYVLLYSYFVPFKNYATIIKNKVFIKLFSKHDIIYINYIVSVFITHVIFGKNLKIKEKLNSKF